MGNKQYIILYNYIYILSIYIYANYIQHGDSCGVDLNILNRVQAVSLAAIPRPWTSARYFAKKTVVSWELSWTFLGRYHDLTTWCFHQSRVRRTTCELSRAAPRPKRHALFLHCTICTLFSTHWTPHDTDSRSISMFCRNCQKWVQPCWLQQACRTYGIAKPLVKGVMKMADRVRRMQSCKIGMPQHESSFCFSFWFADFSLICEGDKLPV